MEGGSASRRGVLSDRGESASGPSFSAAALAEARRGASTSAGTGVSVMDRRLVLPGDGEDDRGKMTRERMAERIEAAKAWLRGKGLDLVRDIDERRAERAARRRPRTSGARSGAASC